MAAVIAITVAERTVGELSGAEGTGVISARAEREARVNICEIVTWTTC